jgi:hypothetical protein
MGLGIVDPMDSDTGPSYPLRPDRPVVTAVVLPGATLSDAATIEDTLALEALDVDVRVLLFARSSDPAGPGDRDGITIIRVSDELANDERALRRKAVADTSGDVYRFLGGARPAVGWMPPDLAGRLRQAGVPHPLEPGVGVGR